MKSIRTIRFAALLIAFVAAASIAATKPADNDKSNEVYTVIYSVADLPVYRLVGDVSTFDASVVTTFIETSIAPESWDRNKGNGSIAEFSQERSIVISQTRENHIRVIDLLASLRKQMKQSAPQAALR